MTAFLTSFLLTAVLTPLVIALAWRRGWVAKPRADRWHSRPTALMGGIAIFLGCALSWWLTGGKGDLLPLALPAAGMFVLGFIDDTLIELRPHQKLIGQLILAAMLIAGGIRLEGVPPAVSLMLSLLWIVGITNAVNLLDNMDGLASGVTAIAAVVLGVAGLEAGDGTVARLSFSLAGACAGFLLYNFNPAKVFMGDCGSLFLGSSLAALALSLEPGGTAHQGSGTALLMPAMVLAIPIFDTTLVAVARALHGRPIMPGYRDHSSHRMVLLGLSERNAVLVLYALALLFGLLSLSLGRLPQIGVLVLAALSAAGLVLLGLYLGSPQVYPEPAEERLTPRARLRRERQLVQVLLDLALIPVAFVGAHLLRFEGALPPSIEAGVLRALPFVVATKLLTLAAVRAYRGSWRFAGAVDALRAALGSGIGSLLVLSLLLLFAGLEQLSRTALIVDWLLFTLFAVGTRTGYVVLQHLFAALAPRKGPEVLMLGADAGATALLRRLADPLSASRARVVGIIDDDPEKQGQTIGGVPVLGTLPALPDLVRSRGIEGCLLGVPPTSGQGQRILAFCADVGIEVTADVRRQASGAREWQPSPNA